MHTLRDHVSRDCREFGCQLIQQVIDDSCKLRRVVGCLELVNPDLVAADNNRERTRASAFFSDDIVKGCEDETPGRFEWLRKLDGSR